MPKNEVFANGMEVACKAADGKSVACFPDPCWSPPSPPAGPVVIPYPNTAFAKDLANGSKTVFISGKPVAKKNVSYFKTSTGNEPATRAFPMGVVTHTIKGKAYFASWSMDVKVEGLNVCRHLDLMTHNHGSDPANTAPWKYVDEETVEECKKRSNGSPHSCCKHIKKLETECKSSNDDDESQKKKKRKKSLLKTLENMATFPDEAAKKAYGYDRKNRNRWVEDYCDGLWVKPQLGEKGKPSQFDAALEMLENATDPLKVRAQAFTKIWELGKERISAWDIFLHGLELGAKSGVKAVIGTATAATGVGLVVTGAMVTWTIADVIETAQEIAKQVGPDALEHLDELKDPGKVVERAKQLAKDLKDKPTKVMAEAQAAKAKPSPCLKARKCMLVQFSQTPAKQAAKMGKGCCPGQSGHHILPDAMFKKVDDKGELLKENEKDVYKDCYKKKGKGGTDGAPTICLEGADNIHGSHGGVHTKMEQNINKYKKKKKKKEGAAAATKISYDDAKTAALASLPRTPNCKKCIEAQLDEHYDACSGDKELRAVSGAPGSHTKIPTPATPAGGGSISG